MKEIPQDIKDKIEEQLAAYPLLETERIAYGQVIRMFAEYGYQLAEREKGCVSEYQLCPKCNGDGHLGRYNSPGMSTTTHPLCDVCNGAKTLIKPIIFPSHQPEKENKNYESSFQKTDR